MKIKRIVPDIFSNQLGASKQFYGEFLGLKLAMDMEWILTFVSESNPTAQINIIKSNDPQNSNSEPAISMEVPDLEKLYEKAISMGYEIVYPITDEPWGVKRFFVKDPNGVAINLMRHIE